MISLTTILPNGVSLVNSITDEMSHENVHHTFLPTREDTKVAHRIGLILWGGKLDPQNAKIYRLLNKLEQYLVFKHCSLRILCINFYKPVPNPIKKIPE